MRPRLDQSVQRDNVSRAEGASIYKQTRLNKTTKMKYQLTNKYIIAQTLSLGEEGDYPTVHR